MKKINYTKWKRQKNSKSLKYHIFLIKHDFVLVFVTKTLLLSSICNKCGSEDKKIFKEEESIEILKILGLVENISFI